MNWLELFGEVLEIFNGLKYDAFTGVYMEIDGNSVDLNAHSCEIMMHKYLCEN